MTSQSQTAKRAEERKLENVAWILGEFGWSFFVLGVLFIVNMTRPEWLVDAVALLVAISAIGHSIQYKRSYGYGAGIASFMVLTVIQINFGTMFSMSADLVLIGIALIHLSYRLIRSSK